jgi:hypothetical protein
MKKHKLLILSIITGLFFTTAVQAQFGGLGKKLLDKGTNYGL